MFDSTSRYSGLETATVQGVDGRVIRYVRRRFLPPLATLPVLTEVSVNQGDRLDLITARTLGAPEQFWRVCDANAALNPVELTLETGRVLRVPIPQP